MKPFQSQEKCRHKQSGNMPLGLQQDNPVPPIAVPFLQPAKGQNGSGAKLVEIPQTCWCIQSLNQAK